LSIALKLGREALGGANTTLVYQVLDNRFLGRKVVEERPDGNICIAGMSRVVVCSNLAEQMLLGNL